MATPGPWTWWTSNSIRRLSSDPSGKDGDVLHAFVARDGVPDVTVSEDDAALIAAAVNALPVLLFELERLRAREAKLTETLTQWREAAENLAGRCGYPNDPETVGHALAEYVAIEDALPDDKYDSEDYQLSHAVAIVVEQQNAFYIGCRNAYPLLKEALARTSLGDEWEKEARFWLDDYEP
jgi:hypothetical protein